ncbi:MAG: hypothetical protein IPN29_07530 [Saprospiraceae bacterium]|nr:hypothetical protein [Saprospiraceae bacterium]
MKERIFTGWHFMRLLYLIIGLAIVGQGIVEKEWLGIFLGGYFTSMAVFAFGCLGGNCAGGKCKVYYQKAENEYLK